MDDTARGIFRYFVSFLATLLALLALTPQAVAQTSANWIVSNAGPDGRIATQADIALPFQSTSEALRALRAVNYGQWDATAALEFVHSIPYEGVESLSRKIMAVAEYGEVPSIWVEALVASQGEDGGFGEFEGYQSTPYDTALALDALAQAGYANKPVFVAAVSYLASVRNPNGAWSTDQSPQSAVIVTSQVIESLWLVRRMVHVTDLVEGGRNYLLSVRDAVGAWGNALETSAALIALYPTLQEKDVLLAAKERLLGMREANGSWGGDLFVTAMALRALAASIQPFGDLGVVSGTVIDGDTGAPLSGVSVTLSGAAQLSAVTDSSGSFLVDNLISGRYDIVLDLEGFQALSSSFQIQSGTEIRYGTLQMLRGSTPSPYATVTGRLTRADTGAPLAQVRIFVADVEKAVTDAEGKYQITSISPGTVSLRAEGDGFESAVAIAELVAGKVALFSPALVPYTKREASVEGTVSRNSDGVPLGGVAIQVEDDAGIIHQATTDAGGFYRIGGLPMGHLIIRAEHHGYWPVQGETDIAVPTIIKFSPRLAELDYGAPTPATHGTVAVTVRDGVGGQALAGARVELFSGDGRVAVTDVEGMAVLDQLPSGAAVLRVSAEGFDPVEYNLEISAGIVLELRDVALYPTGYWTQGGLSGYVVNASSGVPMAGVDIEAVFGGVAYTLVSDTGGRFQLDALVHMEGDIRISRTDYHPVDIGVVLTPGRMLELGEIRMRPVMASELRPDLVIGNLDLTQVANDPLTLAYSGTAVLTLVNEGTSLATGPVNALAFQDANGDGHYTAGADLLLGEASFPGDVAVGQELHLSIPLQGVAPYRDAPIRVWIDSAERVVELAEGNNYATNTGQCSVQDQPVNLDLAMCMDGSGSVSSAEFQLQLQGTAAAIEDPEVVPHDGTVRITVLQFNGSTRVEVQPTIITEENAAAVAAQIRAIRRLGGGTSIHSCINTAVSRLASASPASTMQVIDISTDGMSSRTSAITAAQNAQVAGIDALNAIGVGTGIDRGLLDSIVFPQPPGGERGFVLTINNYGDYADAIASKVYRETRLVDLTAGKLAVIDNGDGSATISVVVGNGGTGNVSSGTLLRLTALRADGTIAWEHESVLEALPAGGHVEVSVNATLGSDVVSVSAQTDPAQSIGECNRTNNRVTRAVNTTRGAITVSTDAVLYGTDAPVQIAAQAGNTGALVGAFDAVLTVEDMAGNVIATFGPFPTGYLTSGSSKDFMQEWNTGNYMAGEYRVRATLFGENRMPLHEAATVFRIAINGDTALTASLAADKPVYEPWSQVNFAAHVTYHATNAIQEPTTALLTVLRADGSAVYSGSTPIGELYPNASADLAFTTWLADENTGDLTATLNVLGADGVVLSSASTVIHVKRQPASGLVGSVDVDHPVVFQGDANLCTETLTNFGNGDIDGVTVRHQVLSMDSGQVLREMTALRDLPGYTTHENVWSISTQDLPVGEYACVLSVQVAGQDKNLAAAGFLVKEPPVRIDAGWQAGSKGRILVLLDDADGDDHCGDHPHHLRSRHGMVVDAGTSVKVQLADAKGRPLATAEWPPKASHAEDEDKQERLSIVSFDHQGLIVRLGGKGSECRHCVLDATVFSHGKMRRLSTGPMDCGCDRMVNSLFGDFAVMEHSQDASNDPHGPRRAPDTTTQRRFLEALLQREGWYYTIVTDARDFADEFHHGGYVAYLLLSEQVKLGEDLQQELIEAVNRGDGLFVAGGHDQRNGRLHEALGIRLSGKHASARGLRIDGSGWTEPYEIALELDERLARITLDGARVIARYVNGGHDKTDNDEQHRPGHARHGHEDKHGASGKGGHNGHAPKDDAAITEHPYGRGRAIYAGFDLLAEAALEGEAGLFADLLNRAAHRAHPEQVPLTGGVAIPLMLTLENQGMPVTGRVLITLPVGTEMVSAAGAVQKPDGTVEWRYSLATDATAQLHLLAIFPATAERVNATIQIMNGASYVDYATVGHVLGLTPTPTLAEAIATAKGLVAARNGADYRKTLRELEQANRELSRGKIAKAVSNLADAAEPLKGKSVTEAVELRLTIDALLRETAHRLP